MKNTKTKLPEIHVGIIGGVRVDAEAFFKQPGVIKKIEMMEKMDIVGKKLDHETLFTEKLQKRS